MKRFSAAFAICLLAAGVSMAAPSVTIDRIDGTYPASPVSGEFRLTPNSELADQLGSIEAFQSFCLEMYAPISMNTTYAAFVNDEAVSGGYATVYSPEGGDPISPATAYLYTEFRNDSLLGYEDGVGRVGSAFALQSAIWYLEEEYVCECGGRLCKLQRPDEAVHRGSPGFWLDDYRRCGCPESHERRQSLLSGYAGVGDGPGSRRRAVEQHRLGLGRLAEETTRDVSEGTHIGVAFPTR